MLNKLMQWEINNRNLRRYGRCVRKINKDFDRLISILDEEDADRSLARSLAKRIPSLMKEIDKSRPKTEFEKLVKREFYNSLFAQNEFVQFIHFKNYTKKWGVEIFLDYMFGDSAEKPKGHALEELEEMAKKINWRQKSRRDQLLAPYASRQLNPKFWRVESRIQSDLIKIKDLLNKYFLDMGFISKKQQQDLKVINNIENIEASKSAMEQAFGTSFSQIEKFIKDAMFNNHGVSEAEFDVLVEEKKQALKNPDTLALYFDLILSDKSTWDASTNQMELDRDEFIYWKDKKDPTQAIKFFPGTILFEAGHENYHRLRTFLSRYMPAGLRGDMGEFSITSCVSDEGLSMLFVDSFLDYLEKSPAPGLEISEKDIAISRLSTEYHRSKSIVEFVSSVYHRLSEHEYKDFEAAKRLAKVIKNPAFSDPKFISHLSIAEAFENTSYIYGLPLIQKIMARLIKEKTKEFGNTRNANRHIKRNHGIYMAGFFIGSWTASTLEDFYFDHYLPKVEKLDLLD